MIMSAYKVGGVKKDQKDAHVIFEWSPLSSNLPCLLLSAISNEIMNNIKQIPQKSMVINDTILLNEIGLKTFALQDFDDFPTCFHFCFNL